MRVGFIKTIDAAPLLVARELGLFAASGIAVDLICQSDWVAVRENLSTEVLDASHALLAMPVMSQFGRAGFTTPLCQVMNLGCGGSAIAISKQLAASGISDLAGLTEHILRTPNARKLTCAYVSNLSVQHYIVRLWLGAAGINPDTDVQLYPLTPEQMASHMAKQYVDIFCAAEPWGTMAFGESVGVMLATSTDVLPDHPDKILAVRRSYAQKHPVEIEKLIIALLQACRYCQDDTHWGDLASILSMEKNLNQPASLILKSLENNWQINGPLSVRELRGPQWSFRSWDPAHCFPSKTHISWLLGQMTQWGEISSGADTGWILDHAVHCDAFRRAARILEIDSPDSDFPPAPTPTPLEYV